MVQFIVLVFFILGNTVVSRFEVAVAATKAVSDNTVESDNSDVEYEFADFKQRSNFFINRFNFGVLGSI